MKKFVVVGHVDSGKSTMCGQILRLTKSVDAHTAAVCRPSELLDIYEEERERGKTHEYTKIEFTVPAHPGCRMCVEGTSSPPTYALIDTPGHKSFIREILSARGDDASNKPRFTQGSRDHLPWFDHDRRPTRIHVILVRALGIVNLIVVINKVDTITDSSRYQIIKKVFGQWVSRLGFSSIAYVAMSAIDGNGILSPHPSFDTPSFFEVLNAIDRREVRSSNRRE